MPTVVGVKLRFAGKVLSFDPAGIELAAGDHVIVSTERGQEYGEIMKAPHEVDEKDLVAPLKPVLRLADEADREREMSWRAEEPREMARFRALVEKHGLDMKPVGVEHLFDNSKMVFYFCAEERVDFRDLVRDLASEFRTRIDLRQIGVRDAARLIGGLGHCGQPLCCKRLSGDFQPVSIRMAKDQDLPLNPLKNSGLCGRLMCCLRYESETYKEFKQRAPKSGTPVVLPTGDGKVVAMNVPRETVTIRHQGGPDITVPLEALDCSAGRGCPCILRADAVPEQPAATQVARSTPTLRVAEQPEQTAASGQAAQGAGRTAQRRKRQVKKTEPAGAAPGAEAPAAPKEQRKRRPRHAVQRQQSAAPPEPPVVPEAGARRRRKRSRPRQGGETTQAPE